MFFAALLLGCSSLPFEGNKYDFESSEGYDPHYALISIGFPAGTPEGVWWQGSHQLDYYGGCNIISVLFFFSDGRMRTGGFASTEIGCLGEVADQDDWFHDLFDSNPWLEVHDDLLVISNGEATLFFRERVEQERPPLED